MGEEEFQESDIVFADAGNLNLTIFCPDDYETSEDKPMNRLRPLSVSEPINIPASGDTLLRKCNFVGGDGGGEVMAPYLIVGRRIELHSGRVLRGRNLCHVRDSILRLIGFFD